MTTVPGRAGSAVCATDLRGLASHQLAPEIWDYVEGGSDAGLTVAANQAAFDSLELWPRVLAGGPDVELGTCLLRSHATMPIAVAPMGFQEVVHPDGEAAAARAAKNLGIPFTVSTVSSQSVEDVAAVGADTWFQLYWLRERDEVERLVRRAEDSGCTALLVTVDVPVMAKRRKDLRNEFVIPCRAANLTSGQDSVAWQLATYTARTFDPAMSWREVEWLCSLTELPLAVKGILHPDDARLAVSAGVDAIVVSNHGGRQLDGAVPSLTALPEVVAAVAGQCQVLLDSGIRSGVDVLKALALGASAVLVGRPVLWGLATDGEQGVTQVLTWLRDELANALTLAGCPDLAAARQLRTTWRGSARS